MANETKTGKLTYIAKTGGIKLDNGKLWYNPVAGLKVEPSLLNKEVILSMTDKPFIFSNIMVADSGERKETHNTIDRKDILISRQVAIKAAAELCGNNPTPDELKGWATFIENWIMRD